MNVKVSHASGEVGGVLAGAASWNDPDVQFCAGKPVTSPGMCTAGGGGDTTRRTPRNADNSRSWETRPTGIPPTASSVHSACAPSGADVSPFVDHVTTRLKGISVIQLYPCTESDRHDYAVGPVSAICNRCSKVIYVAPVGPCGHTVEPAALGARLTCSLPADHRGDHRDSDGASWSLDGQEWAPATR